MATRSVVGYVREDGVVRGTYVHNDGYPEHMMGELWDKLQTLGFDGMKKWIDEGVEGQGYSTVNSDPYNDGDNPWLKEIDEEQYGYTIYPDKIVASQNNELLDGYDSFKLTTEPVNESHSIEQEFVDCVRDCLMKAYEINLDESNEIINENNFTQMLEASPEFVMHYMPEDWARKLYEVRTKESRQFNW